MPEFSVIDIEVVDEMKQLRLTTGVVPHVENICKKALTNLWMITWLKKLGASKEILTDLYTKHVKSLVEYATSVETNTYLNLNNWD